jgi:hypothetical protein
LPYPAVKKMMDEESRSKSFLAQEEGPMSALQVGVANPILIGKDLNCD